jgi:hypothetical protein
LLTTAQIGAVITFEVTASNSAGNSAPGTSTGTSAVLPEVPVNSVLPAISGTAQSGDVLSGGNGTWTNSPTGYIYRWLANGVAIGGATANTFTLTDTQIGTVITFEVTASNAGGSGTPATSSATSAVLPAVPVNSVLPAVSGTAQVGQVLSATNGTWTNSPTGYTYQWFANGTPVAGQIANVFTLTTAQIGEVITIQVTASNSGGSSSPATSVATSAVLPAVPVNSSVPVITGTAQVGDTLSGSDGTWANTPTSYAYEWLANGTPIGGATANTFLLTSAQLGDTITFTVTASNSGGSGSPATSSATSAVASADAYDDMESYSVFSAVSGLNGGTNWLSPYADNSSGVLLGEVDDMESYVSTISLNGLNGGVSYSGSWGGPYVDNCPDIGLGEVDDMESYTVTSALNGLNGGLAYHQFWGGAYVDR